MKNSVAFGFLVVIGLLITTPAEACSRAQSSNAATAQVPEKSFNQNALRGAVLVEVNYHRCRNGLRPVADAGNSLAKLAHDHSRYMAKRKKLSHQNNIPGKKSLVERVRASGVPYRRASENLFMVHRYRLDNRRFKVVSRRDCVFARNGSAIAPHSYASLARYAVETWMASPGHRKNILNPTAKETTVGAAYIPRTEYCGQIWLTQKFVG
ncbi:MAG: CAP domain-containing protein [Pseudomonadota bacterium]